MKHIAFFIILAVLAFSCSQVTHIPRTTYIEEYDFTPYSSKGFLFTPEKYLGEYESVGIIRYSITPEANLVENDGSGNKQFVSAGPMFYWEIEDVNIDNAIEGMYKKCIEMGADALVNFNVCMCRVICPL